MLEYLDLEVFLLSIDVEITISCVIALPPFFFRNVCLFLYFKINYLKKSNTVRVINRLHVLLFYHICHNQMHCDIQCAKQISDIEKPEKF